MKPTSMTPNDVQETIEYYWGKQHIDGYIRKVVSNCPEVIKAIVSTAELMREWVKGDYYESKNMRLAEISLLDFEPLLLEIVLGVAHCTKPELLASVVGRLAHSVKLADNYSAALTLAEVLTLLCHSGLVSISKDGSQGSLMVKSNLNLPNELLSAMDRVHYLPPMVSKPKEVTDNYTAPQLTYDESQILGKRNGHSENICLDVINTQNAVCLSLDEEFLLTLKEVPKESLDTIEKAKLWKQFIAESNEMYNLLLNHGNRFHLTNKVDKRGRLYAQGYHVTTQGSPYKKAMIELANKEVVNGAPN